MENEVSTTPENREIIGYRETIEGKTADGRLFTLRVSTLVESNPDAPLRERKPIMISCNITNDAGKTLDMIRILQSENAEFYYRINDGETSEGPFDLLPGAITEELFS